MKDHKNCSRKWYQNLCAFLFESKPNDGQSKILGGFLSGDKRTYLVCQLGLRVAASACRGIGPGSLDPPTRLQLELSEEAVSHYPSHQHLCDPTRLELIVGQVWSLTYI